MYGANKTIYSMKTKITRAITLLFIVFVLTAFVKTGANNFEMYKPGIYYKKDAAFGATYHIVKIGIYKQNISAHAISSRETREHNGKIQYKYTPLSELAQVTGVDVAINAGFFNPTQAYGEFEETVIIDGNVLNFRADRAVFAWKDKRARIGVWGAVDNVPYKENAIGGGPVFILDGHYNFDPYNEAFSEAVKIERQYGKNARTAIGMTENQKELIIMVVDGNDAFDIGMNAEEMAQILIQDYDVDMAMMLDGGGSSTLIMGEELVNKPNLGETERNILSGIGIVSEEY